MGIPLHELPMGGKAKVLALTNSGTMRRRMLDLGIIPTSTIEAVRKSPAGDPVAYRVRGAVIALRKEEAQHIIVSRLS